jgi:hypothetical protein
MISPFQTMQMQRGLKGTMDRYGGPLGLAGKIIGLGQDQIEEGVPGWALFTLGAMAGGVLVYKLHDKIRRVAGD